MKDTIKQETDAPEARDALRLKAMPIILALELAQKQGYLQPDELISHDELEEAVRERLGLELAESDVGLSDAISQKMREWHWQGLNYDCGLQQFYAQFEKHRANLATLCGTHFLLQAEQVFPGDISDISDDLWASDYADQFLTEDEDGDLYRPTQPDSDETLVNAYLNAHQIKPLGPNGFN